MIDENKIEQIKRLKSLLDSGALTTEEFNLAKKRLLESDMSIVSESKPASDSKEQTPQESVTTEEQQSSETKAIDSRSSSLGPELSPTLIKYGIIGIK